MPTTYYDDNFGCWEEMDDPDKVAFYHQVQKESRLKKCQGCGRKARLRPSYGICNRCADILERGGDLG